MDNNDYLVDLAILEIEKVLEKTFNTFKNDDYERLTPVPFVYKRTIRFVPIQMKELVEELFEMRERMLQLKNENSIKVR